MKRIDVNSPKYPNLYTIIDNENFEWLNQWKWYCDKGYVRRNIKIDGKRNHVYMHRVIIDAPEELQVDHKNLNTLDNRKSNLRLVTHSGNQFNRKKYRTNTSGFKGVTWNKNHQKWQAQLQLNKKRMYLGFFESCRDAAMAYNIAAEKYHGEYARGNEMSSL